MLVQTRVGGIEGPEPEQVNDRVKFWAEAMSELIKTQELFSVMGAAAAEFYRAGARDAAITLLGVQRREVVDADFVVVEEGGEGVSEEASGSEPEESAGADQEERPAEQAAAVAELLGSDPEGPGCDRGDKEEVEA